MADRKGMCSRISVYLTRRSRTLECKRQKPKLAAAKRQTYWKAHVPIWGEQECHWTSETAGTRDSQPPSVLSFLCISL